MPGCAVLHYVTRLTPEQAEAHMQGLIAQADAWFAERRAEQ